MTEQNPAESDGGLMATFIRLAITGYSLPRNLELAGMVTMAAMDR